MNIWFFNHYAVPPTMYPLARPYNFAKHLSKRKHNVTIFAASTVHNSNINLISGNESFKKDEVESIKYVYLKASNYSGNGKTRVINMFQYTIGLFKITKNFIPPNVIIATSVHPLACVAGIKIAKRYKCKCIIEIADLWPLTLIEFGLLKSKSLTANLLYRLEHWIYKNADSIIFTMEGGKQYICDKGWENDVTLDKIFHINNGIDLDIYKQQREHNIFKDKDLENAETFKVVYTGTLGQANAVKYILEAAKLLRDLYKDIRILIFGDGYQRQELEDYCKKNCLDNVLFKGRVEKKYIPNILSHSNLNIMTGEKLNIYKYGLSFNKLFDYIASERPVVSNIQCEFDILSKYGCGKTVGSDDATALADAIKEFYLMSDIEYNSYCTNATIAAKNYDFKILTDKLERIIYRTIN